MASSEEPRAALAAADALGEATLELFALNDAYNRFLWRGLNRLSPVAGRVLEVGCGIGNLTRRILAEPGVTAVHAIDCDPAYIERLQASIPDPRLTASASSIEEFQPGALEAAAEGSYDAVVSSNVLEHIADDAAALRRFARLLRPGGTALILVPAHEWLYCDLDRNLSHHRRYSRRRLEALGAASGLELIRARHFNPLGVLGWWLNGKLLGRGMLPAGQLRAYARLAIPLSALLDRWNPFPLGISLLAAFARPPGSA
jgi:SAM-dependent methyltransferase